VLGLARRLRRVQALIGELAESMTCDRGDFMEYAEIRRRLTEAERGASRSRASAQRAEALRVLATLRRGDIIRVPSGRRAGMAVVLAPPPAADSAPARADGPLVLTAQGKLKQLSAADFPVPAEPVERLRVPAWFSERSPKHRRDLVSSMRSKLASRDLDLSPRGRRVTARDQLDDPERSRADSGAGDGFQADVDDDGRPNGDGGDIAQLRRRLRRHPCHGCPDRELHARFAERYFRQRREAEELERQIGGRSHVIARTFGRVCAVLDQLGYLDGDTVTPDGRRLARLYAELDLLAAECLRRGFWAGLNPAELAACVSVLSFESRQIPDDEPPARLPKGPVRDVLPAMTRTWGELDQLEKRSGLSFLREPDPGFVWAAYRWARGAKLEDVLDSVPGLTPGDFVRSTKQLIDLLDQIAAAADYAAAEPTSAQPAETQPAAARPAETQPAAKPAAARSAETQPAETRPAVGQPAETRSAETQPADSQPAETRPADVPPRDRGVAATARAAIDAMRRGVVAYSSLTD
jgi:ATP-dependent RNA helicase HelY